MCVFDREIPDFNIFFFFFFFKVEQLFKHTQGVLGDGDLWVGLQVRNFLKYIHKHDLSWLDL